jgi:hypothetical protein
MNATTFEEEMALNKAAYDRLRDEIRRDYAGKYVAIAQGRLAAVSASFDDATAEVLKLNPVPEHFVVFEAEGDPMFDLIDDPYRTLVGESLEEVG